MKNVLFIMPYDKKEVNIIDNGNTYTKTVNFDEVYDELKTEIESLGGLIVTRVDMEIGTNIHSKMYDMIEKAEIVVADLAGYNPNVVYELGVRHALKDRVTILFKSVKDNLKIPFDFLTNEVVDKDKLLNGFIKLISNENCDSPVRGSMTDSTKEELFENYESKRDKLMKGYNNIPSNDYKKRLDYLEDVGDVWKDNMSFDLLHSLNIYKSNESDYINLSKALEIVNKYTPELSNEGEVLGQACSIYRRMYEIEPEDEVAKDKSIELALRFITNFNSTYSHSSLILHFITSIEHGHSTIDEAKVFLGLYSKKFKKIHSDNRDIYYWFTDTLYKLILRNETSDYEKKLKDHPDLDKHTFETSKKTYERVLELMKKGGGFNG